MLGVGYAGAMGTLVRRLVTGNRMREDLTYGLMRIL
jgi:hypothetical protein